MTFRWTSSASRFVLQGGSTNKLAHIAVVFNRDSAAELSVSSSQGFRQLPVKILKNNAEIVETHCANGWQ